MSTFGWKRTLNGNDLISPCKQQKTNSLRDQKPVRYKAHFGNNFQRSATSDISDEELIRLIDDPFLQMPINFVGAQKFRSISVSSLAAQQWCEQQQVFKLHFPFIIGDDGKVRHVDDRPEMKTGTTAHENREIVIQDVIPIRCYSRSDRIAIDGLNCFMSFVRLLEAMTSNQNCTCCEVPLFYLYEKHDLLIKGVADEIRFCITDNVIQVIEFKTMNIQIASDKYKSESIRKSHQFQASIYCYLLENMIKRPQTIRKALYRHLKLNGSQILSANITRLVNSIKTLDDLFDLLECTLKKFSQDDYRISAKIEYSFTNTDLIRNQSIPNESYFEYNREITLKQLEESMEFWLGLREPKSVEIEDCWKCQTCSYKDRCLQFERLNSTLLFWVFYLHASYKVFFGELFEILL